MIPGMDTGSTIPESHRQNTPRHLALIALVAAGWLVLWVLPWQSLLGAVPWLRIIIALLIFILPGALTVSLITDREPADWVRLITLGFAVSLAATGLMGTAARTLKLSFDLMMLLLTILGVTAIVLHGLRNGYTNLFKHGRWRKGNDSARWLAIMTVVAALLLAITTVGRFGGDEKANAAYITHWQHEDTLDYNEVYLDEPRLDSQRYWLAHFMLAEAVISTISQIPSLPLIGNYLGPPLVLLALLGFYQLAQTLGLSQRGALLTTLAQATCLMMLSGFSQPGLMLIRNLTTDKAAAAFIITPILFSAAIDYLERPAWREFALLAFAAIAMMYTHPTALAISAMIIGGYGLLHAITTREARPFVVMCAIILVAIAPLYALRFVEGPLTDRVDEVGYFSVEDALASGYLENRHDHQYRLYLTQNPRLYAVNVHLMVPPNLITREERLPGTRRYILWNGLVILGLAFTTLLALRRSWEDDTARLVFAACIVLWIAIIPVSAPILGRFMGAFQLWRVPWQFPYGIGLIFTGREILRLVWKQALNQRIAPLLTGFVLLNLLVWTLPPNLPEAEKVQDYEDLFALSTYLDTVITEPTGATGFDGRTNDMLLGLSHQFDVIYIKGEDELFRHGVSRERASARVMDWRILARESSTDAEREDILNQYGIEVIIIKQGEGVAVRQSMAAYPARFVHLHSVGLYDVYRVTSTVQ